MRRTFVLEDMPSDLSSSFDHYDKVLFSPSSTPEKPAINRQNSLQIHTTRDPIKLLLNEDYHLRIADKQMDFSKVTFKSSVYVAVANGDFTIEIINVWKSKQVQKLEGHKQ